MTETWRPIPGWPGYDVSDAGRVRSWRRSRRYPDAPLPRVLAQRRDPAGYARVNLRDLGRVEAALVHALVCAAFIGPRPAGLHVAHGNGDRRDNRLANLRYATARENAADAVRLGERGTRARLDAATVAALRWHGGTHRQAAEACGVTYWVARRVRRVSR